MKKLICLLVAVALLLTIFAYSEEKPITPVIYGKVSTADGSQANIYRLPGEYRQVVGTVANGTSLFVEFEGSTWHKVKTVSGNTSGWIKASDMTITTRGLSALNYGCTITGVKSVYSSDGQAALRWGPGLEYDLIDNLKNGTYCYVYEVTDNWTRVLLSNGVIGYVHNSLLRNSSSQVGFPGGLYGYVQVTGNSAIYRQSPSYSSRALGTFQSGDVVDILGETNGFWYIYNPSVNVYGYISKDILSPEGLNRVKNISTLYYDNPYMYYTDALWTLNVGQVLKVLATDGYVSRVQYDNVIGYVTCDSLIINH